MATVQTIDKVGTSLPGCNEGAQLLHFIIRSGGVYAARSGWNAASYVISLTPCAALLRRSAGFGRQFKNCPPSAAKGGATTVMRSITRK